MYGAKGTKAAYPKVSAAEVVSAFIFVSRPIYEIIRIDPKYEI